jgi:hypothetical protein
LHGQVALQFPHLIQNYININRFKTLTIIFTLLTFFLARLPIGFFFATLSLCCAYQLHINLKHYGVGLVNVVVDEEKSPLIPNSFKRQVDFKRKVGLMLMGIMDEIFTQHQPRSPKSSTRLFPSNQSVAGGDYRKQFFITRSRVILAVGVIGGAIAFDKEFFADTPDLPLLATATIFITQGYICRSRAAAEQIIELIDKGMDIKTLCYPNSKRVDPTVVKRYYDIFQQKNVVFQFDRTIKHEYLRMGPHYRYIEITDPETGLPPKPSTSVESGDVRSDSLREGMDSKVIPENSEIK